MKKILVVFGTRPEAVKMCPLIRELKKRGCFRVIVCFGGQHRRMAEQVMEYFQIVPDYDLDVMKEGQNLFDVTLRVLERFQNVLEETGPDLVLVHGDTTTAFAAALACYYMRIPVGHVEAGLRTNNLYSPYPEEFNRKTIDSLSSLCFAPTKQAGENLRREGIPASRIYVTGNTGIDALKRTVRGDYHHELLDWASGSRLLLITAHRRENLGRPMERMFSAICRIIEENPDVKAVYPVHMNEEIRGTAERIFHGNGRIRLTEPMNVFDFHNFMARCWLILTDSGGIQEEAAFLGKPVLVMREVTERQEGIENGNLKLAGTTEESICRAFRELLRPEEYRNMCAAENPFGDGEASRRIADILSCILRNPEGGIKHGTQSDPHVGGY